MAFKKYKSRNFNRHNKPGLLPDLTSMLNLPSQDVDFFQFEPAIVTDIILTPNHPEVEKSTLMIAQSPPRHDLSSHKKGDVDLSFVGRALVRLIHSHNGAKREDLKWAIPMDPTISEYPVLNEIVNVIDIKGHLYYTPRINLKNRLNLNADYGAEIFIGDGQGPIKDPENVDEPYKGPDIKFTTSDSDFDRNHGVSGRYFFFNHRIRRLKRWEGDYLIQSRFGQSIRMGVYDENRTNDAGYEGYPDYYNPVSNPNGGQTGWGNPMVLIRNRQRKIVDGTEDVEGNLDVTDVDAEYETQFNSDIIESVNWDGSSIHMTSGITVSKWDWKKHYKKKFFSQEHDEEQPNYSSQNKQIASRWKLPVLNGDQIVIFSDRLILGSRHEETLMFSKKRFAITTDQEYTVDAHEQMVFTTNEKVVFNSPHIYLGEYNQTREPALLGETSIEWLYALCEWLEKHQHWYHHTHPDAGGGHDGSAPTGDSNKPYTQVPVDQHVTLLQQMKKRLPELCSKRVFLTGGGYAKGWDGKPIEGLRNDRVGIFTKTPGGYYVSKTGTFGGVMEGSSTNGEVEPSTQPKGTLNNPHIKSHPDRMKSSH